MAVVAEKRQLSRFSNLTAPRSVDASTGVHLVIAM